MQMTASADRAGSPAQEEMVQSQVGANSVVCNEDIQDKASCMGEGDLNIMVIEGLIGEHSSITAFSDDYDEVHSRHSSEQQRGSSLKTERESRNQLSFMFDIVMDERKQNSVTDRFNMQQKWRAMESERMLESIVSSLDPDVGFKIRRSLSGGSKFS